MNKYGNKKTIYNGKIYDSKKEANRAFELDMLKKAKLVEDFEAQFPLSIIINGVKVCKYVADFKVKYSDRVEYEDVKSDYTKRLPLYRIKKKLVLAVLGIDIKEV